jgi:hypothetical protein
MFLNEKSLIDVSKSFSRRAMPEDLLERYTIRLILN